MVSEPPRRKKLPEVNTLADVVELIRKSQKIIILTGAGVSVSCGIPDFRSRNGIYARLAVDFPDLPDPQAMFDIHYFRKDPRPFFKFAKEIYPGQFEPSPCHKFIKSVENHGKLLRNYTQNIGKLFNLLKFALAHTSCEDALKEKKISEQTTGQALFWTYFCIRICVEANDLATSKQGLVYITI